MNTKISCNRIYHPFHLWEDHKAGFYNNCSGKEKEIKGAKVLEMFNSEKLTKKFMEKASKEWKYSFEHNMTNEGLNKIAYIGQAACCLYAEIPNTVTMEYWNLLEEDIQERANKQAEETLNNWVICQNQD